MRFHCAHIGHLLPSAVALLKIAKDEGTWVLLHNCHLMSSWMPTLEAIVGQFKTDVDAGRCHEDFRLWLTAMPVRSHSIAVACGCRPIHAV
eukprot:SAG22_NODE_187_length_15860_cov_44.770446_21_plen_91_part_00